LRLELLRLLLRLTGHAQHLTRISGLRLPRDAQLLSRIGGLRLPRHGQGLP